MASTKQPTTAAHKTFTIIGIIMCIILIPMLIMNIFLIAQSYINPDKVPGIGGHMPMIVLTESMEPTINAGDLIITKSAKAEDIEVGDIISYFDPESNKGSIVTHRVNKIVPQDDGTLSFETYGDNNKNADGEYSIDKTLVPEDDLIGTYRFRIAGFGHVAMFMQSIPGLIVCVLVPLLLLVAYDIIRRKQFEKANKKDTDALLAELEALKAEKAALDAKAETSDIDNNVEVPANNAE